MASVGLGGTWDSWHSGYRGDITWLIFVSVVVPLYSGVCVCVCSVMLLRSCHCLMGFPGISSF